MNNTTCSSGVAGYEHNGDCNLVCKPTEWKDILIFFLGNYVAHAATVVARPGQSDLTSILSIILAVCFPGAGVLTGIRVIASCAVFAPTELTKAVRAGALCIVVREDIDDVQDDTRLPRGGTFAQPIDIGRHTDRVFPPAISSTKVNGVSRLPRGCSLLILPPWTTFRNDGVVERDSEGRPLQDDYYSIIRRQLSSYFGPRDHLNGNISCSHNLVKILVALGQLIFTSITIYQARGDQVEVFGMAAFGLTVAPYVWMSFVNLLGNLLCPQYETVTIVNSPTLDRLRDDLQAQGLSERYPFHNTLGRISDVMESRVLQAHASLLKPGGAAPPVFRYFASLEDPENVWPAFWEMVVAIAVASVPIAIVGGISEFKAGSSALYQRVWTLLWLCMGPTVGVTYGTVILPILETRPVLWTMSSGAWEGSSVGPRLPQAVSNQDSEKTIDAKQLKVVSQYLFLLLFASLCVYVVPAIGGFVVVGQMLKRYGTCVGIR